MVPASPPIGETLAPASGIGTASAPQPKLAGGICAVAVVGLLLWITHNRYLPIVDGWFSEYAKLMHDGKLPYRDFYFFTQPLSLLISWAVYGISDQMIYMRYYGILERVCLTAALYFLISRRFSASASFWATVVPMLVFLTYSTEAFFTYLVTCCLFFVLSLLCLHLALTKVTPARLMWFFLAGVSASLSFLSKQSNGLVVTAIVVFLAAVLTRPSKDRALNTSFTLLGWAIPQLFLLLWLNRYGLTHDYFQQVFLGGTASKGGPALILFGFLTRAATPLTLGVILLLVMLGGRAYRRRRIWLDLQAREPAPPAAQTIVFAVAAAACLLIPYWLPAGLMVAFVLKSFFVVLSRVLFWGALACSVIVLAKLLRGRLQGDPLIAIVTLGGFSWAYASGLSYAVEQQAVLLLFSLAIAAGHDALRSADGKVRRNLIALFAGFVFMTSWQKYAVAFEWTGSREPISHNGVASHWPRLAGYRTDPKLMGMLDTILDDVARYSRRGEPVFTFPHMPMFNFVADRPQPTFAVVHYWDVCPDWVAQADALRVRDAGPRVIIEMHFNERTWRIHEESFRPGHPSGQRAIQRVIDDLVSSGDYELVRIFRPDDFLDDFIRVWVRVR
jgi:hypothetical protein